VCPFRKNIFSPEIQGFFEIQGLGSRLLILQLTVEFMNAIGYNEVNDYLIKEMK